MQVGKADIQCLPEPEPAGVFSLPGEPWRSHRQSSSMKIVLRELDVKWRKRTSTCKPLKLEVFFWAFAEYMALYKCVEQHVEISRTYCTRNASGKFYRFGI